MKDGRSSGTERNEQSQILLEEKESYAEDDASYGEEDADDYQNPSKSRRHCPPTKNHSELSCPLQVQRRHHRRVKTNTSSSTCQRNAGKIDSSSNSSGGSKLFVIVTVGVLMGLVSGSMYGFGRYVRALKETLGLTQLQAQRFGILMDAGSYMGHPATGYYYDRFGPKAAAVSAAAVVFAAYASIHCAVNGAARSGNSSDDNINDGDSNTNTSSSSSMLLYYMLNVSFTLIGFGSGLGNVAALGTITRYFQSTPWLGRAIAAQAAGYGLCSMMVGIAYNAAGLRRFFFVWGITMAAVYGLGAVCLDSNNTNNNKDDGPSRNCHQDANDNEKIPKERVRQDEQEGKACYGSMEAFDRRELLLNVNNNSGGDIEVGKVTAVTSAAHEPETVVRTETAVPAVPDEEETAVAVVDVVVWTTWRNFDFWMLLCLFASFAGCGLFVINNLSTMVQSIGGTDSLAGVLFFTLSTCNLSGRVIMGLLLDQRGTSQVRLLQSCAFLISAALTVSAVVSATTTHHEHHGNGAAPSVVALSVTTVITATAYGGSWVAVVAIITHRYGSAHFGIDYGFMCVGPALSGMIINTASAWLYQRQSDRATGICLGPACYRTSFLLTALTALCGGCLLSLLPNTRKK